MVLMGTKDCVFLQMYEELYKLHYDRDAWYFNGGELPQYAILDKYPGVAFLADEGVQQGKYHRRLIHEHINVQSCLLIILRYQSTSLVMQASGLLKTYTNVNHCHFGALACKM